MALSLGDTFLSSSINSSTSLATIHSTDLPSSSSSFPSSTSATTTPERAQSLVPLIGLTLSCLLTLLCFWRLMVFTIISMRYRYICSRMISWKTAFCWCLVDENETETSFLLQQQRRQPTSTSPAYVNSPFPTTIVPPSPRSLIRKLIFHIALFWSVLVDLPSWIAMFLSSSNPWPLGEAAGQSITALPSAPMAAALYLLHLLTYPFTFLAMAIVLDMWLTVAEFDPYRHLKLWRGLAMLSLMCFILLWGWTTFEASQIIDHPPASIKGAETTVPRQVAESTSASFLAQYTAAVLLLLALAFLFAGCLIQQRIISVFANHPGERLAWINLFALARLSAVTLICLICFLLRSVDLGLPSHRGHDYFEGFLHCPTSSIGGIWGGIILCYGRWAIQALPVLALLYIMRHTGIPREEGGGSAGPFRTGRQMLHQQQQYGYGYQYSSSIGSSATSLSNGDSRAGGGTGLSSPAAIINDDPGIEKPPPFALPAAAAVLDGRRRQQQQFLNDEWT